MTSKIIALCFTLFSSAAFPCSIYHESDNLASDLIKEAGRFNFSTDVFEPLCQKLQAKEAGLDIYAVADVTNGVSIGYAHVSLLDRKTGIISRKSGNFRTIVNSKNPSTQLSRELALNAINDAVVEITKDVDRYLADLDIKVKDAKRDLAKKPSLRKL